MSLLLCSLILLVGGGLTAFCAGRGLAANRIGSLSAACASGLGLVPALQFLAASAEGAASANAASWSLNLGGLPMGAFSLQMDAFSSVFLLPVLLLSSLCAVYGGSAMKAEADAKHLGAHWLFYSLLVAGMVLALTAADAFLFLLSWELMSVVPFFLISVHDEHSDVRSAAWVYLVAAHLGALFLLAFFALLSSGSGGVLSFRDFLAANGALAGSGQAGLLFILAFVGFGAKIGLMPMHVWLPEAHPAAPSHVSALMSGAVIKIGLYGLIRALSFIGPGETWWACALIGVGAFTGFTGILLALAQPSIKRSLAYSSVENMGIICMALGIGLFCIQRGQTGPAYLALAGALVHMVNHALSKGLLFLCAGCVLHGAGTLSFRLLGGLQKRLPVVGCCFALGSAAIAALPPFNGFAGEFLIYLGLTFGGAIFTQGIGADYSLLFWFCLFVLAGIGGFTLLCFARIYGMAFLGEARSPAVGHTHPPADAERAVLLVFAALCLISAASSPVVARHCRDALPSFAPAARADAAPALAAAPPLSGKPSVTRPRFLETPHMEKNGPE